MSKAKAIENKEIVQAIVIADSYNDNFQPFTSTKPLVSATHEIASLAVTHRVSRLLSLSLSVRLWPLPSSD